MYNSGEKWKVNVDRDGLMLQMTQYITIYELEKLYYEYHFLKVFAYISVKTTLNYIGIIAPIFNKDVLQSITQDQQFMNVSSNSITTLHDHEQSYLLKMPKITKSFKDLQIS